MTRTYMPRPKSAYLPYSFGRAPDDYDEAEAYDNSDRTIAARERRQQRLAAQADELAEAEALIALWVGEAAAAELLR